jgi:hypothetical protein
MISLVLTSNINRFDSKIKVSKRQVDDHDNVNYDIVRYKEYHDLMRGRNHRNIFKS